MRICRRWCRRTGSYRFNPSTDADAIAVVSQVSSFSFLCDSSFWQMSAVASNSIDCRTVWIIRWECRHFLFSFPFFLFFFNGLSRSCRRLASEYNNESQQQRMWAEFDEHGAFSAALLKANNTKNGITNQHQQAKQKKRERTRKRKKKEVNFAPTERPSQLTM